MTQANQSKSNGRFNCLTSDDQLHRFDSFYIAPNRTVTDGENSETEQCEAGFAEFWSIYGWIDGSGSEAVHDEFNASDCVRIAHQILIETGKGFSLSIPEHGHTASFIRFDTLCEFVTEWIHDDLPDIGSLDARADDFDNHALAELREALSDHSDYQGIGTALDPYAPTETMEGASQ